MYSLLLAALLSAQMTGGIEELMPQYSIQSDSLDPALAEGTTSMDAVVKDGYGQRVLKDAILILHDGTTLRADSEGRISEVIPSGTYAVTVSCPGYTSHRIDSITFSPKHKMEFHFYMVNIQYDIEAEKPVIYLYPEDTTQVSVTLDYQGRLTMTYPPYDKGWEVQASPSGDLMVDGNTYKYLFWEGEQYRAESLTVFDEGFLVSGEEVTRFLEEKLSRIGLTSQETADFVTYWAPRMSRNPMNAVKFIWGQEYSELVAGIHVLPEPSTYIRLFMVFQAMETGGELIPQELPSYKREGFTLVEWGGAELDKDTDRTN